MARSKRKLQLVPAQTPNAAPQVDAGREYVSAPGLSFAQAGTPLPAIERGDECLTDETYRLMLQDSEVSANVWLLVNAVLADGVTLHPKEIADDEARSQTANDIAAFLQSTLETIPKPFIKTMKGMLKNAIQYGHKIAEQTWAIIESGPDAGKIGLASIKLKPRSAVSFVVDPYWNVVGFQARQSIGVGAGEVLPREKFVVLTLREEDEDPRGRSWLRAAVNAWCFKTQSVWPNYDKFLQRFGEPSLVGTTAENAKDQVLKNPTTGAVLVDSNGRPRTLTAQDALLTALLAFKGGTAMAVPFGAKVDALEVANEGQAFDQANINANSEITRAMLFQVRATNEAQHGSKADSATGEGILEKLIWDLKGEVAPVIEKDILRPLLIANFGAENLDLMPFVSLGDTDRKDWATDAEAAVKLGPSLTDSQWKQITGQLGIDAPLEGEELPKRAASAIGQPTDNNQAPPTNPATPNDPTEQTQ